MPGIVGIFEPGRREQVRGMLDRIAHRGGAGSAILELEGATLGVVWPSACAEASVRLAAGVQDHVDSGHFAQAQLVDGHPLLRRDPLGVASLYYGRLESGALGFASEVKGLLPVTRDVNELPPGHRYDGDTLECYFRLRPQPWLQDSPERVAQELHRRLTASVERCAEGRAVAAWLSGGVDSSTIAALARPYVKTLHTFAAGFPGAADLTYAREVADFIGSEHHEVLLDFDQALALLPEVIFHLESFDAWLVRSSVMNYVAARAASDHVSAVLSGEGGDELFAGYEYLRSIDLQSLEDELMDITARLHNTALQRVDRCAAAHGTVAHVCFLAPEVVDYALRIPVELKLRDGVGKWILRRAIEGMLPERVLHRGKAKFWEGAGIGNRLAAHAEDRISDADFAAERTLSNGWQLNTKEELMYYRLFKEAFGPPNDLSWMGRTKDTPRAV